MRTKLKALEAGSVVDRTFRAGEKFARVHTEVKNVQYLYDDGSEAHFMDEETYEQFGLPHAEVADELAYLPPSSSVQMLQVDGKPSGIQLPASVELTVTQTEPAVRGDTVTNVTKPATLETGQSCRCRCSSTEARRSRSTRARVATSAAPELSLSAAITS